MRLPKPATAGHRMWLQVTNARNTRPIPDHAAACATRGGAASHSQPARSRASAPAAWRRRGAGRPAHLLVDAAPALAPCCTHVCVPTAHQPCPPAHAGPRRAVPRPRPLAPPPRAASSPPRPRAAGSPGASPPSLCDPHVCGNSADPPAEPLGIDRRRKGGKRRARHIHMHSGISRSGSPIL